IGQPDRLVETIRRYRAEGASVAVAAGRSANRAREVLAQAGLGLPVVAAKVDDAVIAPASVDRGFLLRFDDRPVLALAGEKARSRARRAVQDIARELVVLYAQRVHSKGHAFGPDTPWQRELEDAFPYLETPDQARAIDEVKADMERDVPMDRLICGDVGYG